MKILAFAGTNSSLSINKKLIKFALQNFKDDSIEFLDLKDYEMPLFSIDLEKVEQPKNAFYFLQKIESCDGIICSLAEHNKSYTVAFKNLLDWCSRINGKVFQNKPMFLMATSTGEYGGGNVLNTAKTFFPMFGADIKADFSLPTFDLNFDENRGITNADKLKEFNEKINVFKDSLKSSDTTWL
ncbi:MAG TPA: NAD(P)H-dependent oxidoreductase [Chitinophagales bacterium]|nr:NAD(P)H-dependent oxidoreductase [Chitinophagales bacterium]